MQVELPVHGVNNFSDQAINEITTKCDLAKFDRKLRNLLIKVHSSFDEMKAVTNTGMKSAHGRVKLRDNDLQAKTNVKKVLSKQGQWQYR